MSEENATNESKPEGPAKKAAPKKAKKATPKKAKKATPKKATPKKAAKVEIDTPRGFASDEAAKRVVEAHKILAKKFPKMTANDREQYLHEVGAGRYMALRRFES